MILKFSKKARLPTRELARCVGLSCKADLYNGGPSSGGETRGAGSGLRRLARTSRDCPAMEGVRIHRDFIFTTRDLLLRRALKDILEKY